MCHSEPEAKNPKPHISIWRGFAGNDFGFFTPLRYVQNDRRAPNHTIAAEGDPCITSSAVLEDAPQPSLL